MANDANGHDTHDDGQDNTYANYVPKKHRHRYYKGSAAATHNQESLATSNDTTANDSVHRRSIHTTPMRRYSDKIIRRSVGHEANGTDATSPVRPTAGVIAPPPTPVSESPQKPNPSCELITRKCSANCVCIRRLNGLSML